MQEKVVMLSIKETAERSGVAICKEKTPLEREQKIPITFRIPEELYQISKQDAERMGIPQTSLLLMYIDLGSRLYKTEFSLLDLKK